MYNVYAMNSDKQKFVVCYNGQPAVFDTDLDAWDFVRYMMEQKEKERIRFMWVKEVTREHS